MYKSAHLRDFLFRLRYGFRGIPVRLGSHAVRLDESLRRWDCRNEAPLQKLLQEQLKTGDRVVDVGANFGYHTLLCASCVGPSGHVYAFEPVPANCRLLERHIALNHFGDRVTLVPQAVSDVPGGTIELRGVREGVSITAGINRQSQAGVTIRVPVTTLDESLANRPGPIRLIKIDVEGAEQLVLRGASRLLAEDRPLLAVEVHSFALPLFGSSAENFRREVEALGYAEQVIDTVAGEDGDYYHALYSPKD